MTVGKVVEKRTDEKRRDVEDLRFLWVKYWKTKGF